MSDIKSTKKSKGLKSIKSNWFSRGVSLTKLVVESGARVASAKVQHTLSRDDSSDSMDEAFRSNAEAFVRELGRLKGSAMKFGQSLAIIAEHFFPKDIADILKGLNESSEEVAWSSMAAALEQALGRDKLKDLRIEPNAFASASLGQVHRAQIVRHVAEDAQADEGLAASSGEWICLKIQYPGVDQSIDSDLAAIKTMFRFSKILPDYGPKMDSIFAEIRDMLESELDYEREASSMRVFSDLLGEDPRYVVPVVYPEWSGRRVLATSYEPGDNIDGLKVASLDVDRRSRLAHNFAELLLREIFEFRLIQSDPHFGNYKIRLAEDGGTDQLVLLDFGAMRAFDRDFIAGYSEMVRGAVQRDEGALLAAGYGLQFIREDDSEDLKQQFVDLCYLVVEPWVTPETPLVDQSFFNREGYYDWNATDLPRRVREQSTKFALAYKFRPPPPEVIFLDRKLAGAFTALKVLNAPFDGHRLLMTVLARCDAL